MSKLLFKDKYLIPSSRLGKWDYSSNGSYFVTICTKYRINCLSVINNGKIRLSAEGQVVKNCWHNLPKHYPNCLLDAFVIMPNHVHGIINIHNNLFVETGLKPVSTDNKKYYSLSEIIRGLKTFSAKQINIIQNEIGHPFWQTRFYDRIIRNEYELYQIRKYILENSKRWDLDKDNPKNYSTS